MSSVWPSSVLSEVTIPTSSIRKKLVYVRHSQDRRVAIQKLVQIPELGVNFAQQSPDPVIAHFRPGNPGFLHGNASCKNAEWGRHKSNQSSLFAPLAPADPGVPPLCKGEFSEVAR